MKHSDDVAKAVSLLKQTLPEMNKRNIAATPNNYAIWYEFVNGDNKELHSAIEKLDQNKSAYTQEVLQQLYDKFIANAHEAAVNKLSQSVKEVINDVLSRASKEGQGLSEYAGTLSRFSKQVSHASEIDDIKHLIAELLEETRKRETATLSMQSSLETMAIEMKKLRSEVAKLNSEATTDALTKVNNRRAFDIEVENFITHAKANHSNLCLVMMDMDNFDAFNKKFGQHIGDKVLRFVATLLKNNIKGRDSVARFYGATFALLLPETEYEGAMRLAENIREKLAKQTLSDSAEKIELGTVTASFGVAPYHLGEISDHLIRRAERCIHKAKQSGKNRVVGDPHTPIQKEKSSSSTYI